MKFEKIVIKVPKMVVKGRIEPGTRHGSRPHRNKKVYDRNRNRDKGGE